MKKSRGVAKQSGIFYWIKVKSMFYLFKLNCTTANRSKKHLKNYCITLSKIKCTVTE